MIRSCLPLKKKNEENNILKEKKRKRLSRLKIKLLGLREQRKRWKYNSRKYRQRIKENLNKKVTLETIQVEAAPFANVSNVAEKNLEEEDPLQHDRDCPAVKRAVRKIRYREFKKRKALMSIINTLKKKNESQRKSIINLQKKIDLIKKLPFEDTNKKINNKPTKELNLSAKSTSCKNRISEIIHHFILL